jgi:hypothetical protein
MKILTSFVMQNTPFIFVGIILKQPVYCLVEGSTHVHTPTLRL